MPIQLDHLILPVADLDRSIEFFTAILGCPHEGEDGPFSVIRVTPDLTLLLAPWGTDGGMHLAFALLHAEFDAAFDRVKAAGIPYGDSFHAVGNMQGPGAEWARGARARRSTSSTRTSTSSRSGTTTPDPRPNGARCSVRVGVGDASANSTAPVASSVMAKRNGRST